MTSSPRSSGRAPPPPYRSRGNWQSTRCRAERAHPRLGRNLAARQTQNHTLMHRTYLQLGGRKHVAPKYSIHARHGDYVHCTAAAVYGPESAPERARGDRVVDPSPSMSSSARPTPPQSAERRPESACPARSWQRRTPRATFREPDTRSAADRGDDSPVRAGRNTVT
ncbi:hypothetical protein OH76DRAFT_145413 [Lentinus brumalis]|uniref:Uncharacterized protein n=1 Tax=Lentinus brumalis TaxID=2498619 RepID=A0A371CP95_9APHY|nr:hypothetical protein OH76DRAFT_145413 [Polyporus brumalis]